MELNPVSVKNLPTSSAPRNIVKICCLHLSMQKYTYRWRESSPVAAIQVICFCFFYTLPNLQSKNITHIHDFTLTRKENFPL